MFRIACIAACKLSFNLCFSTASQPLLTACLDLLKRIVKVPAAHVSKDACGLYVELLGSFDLQLAVCWHVSSKQQKMWFQGVDPKQAGRETQQQQAGVHTSTDTNVHLDGDGPACDPNMWL